MVSRLHLIRVGATVMGVILLACIYVTATSILQLNLITHADSPGSLLAETFKLQRNKVSQVLNEAKWDIAKASCELQELKSKGASSVSANGGWCRRSSYNNSGLHLFDRSLAHALSKFCAGKMVASFGDGPGDYKRYIDKTGFVKVYDAFDGAPYGPETSGGAVKFLDLTAPQYGLPVYDWVISLEVAEHIPAKFESIYVDNLVRHAGIGIILSWARLGQGGTSHVNNKPLEYVVKILSEKGFDADLKESKDLQNKASLPWLKNNVYVYRRRKGSFATADLA